MRRTPLTGATHGAGVRCRHRAPAARTPFGGARAASAVPAAAAHQHGQPAAAVTSDESWRQHRAVLMEAVLVAAESGTAADVMRTIDELVAFGFDLHKEACFAAIRALARLGHTANMARVAELTRRAGHPLTQQVLTSMLFAHAKRLDARAVLAVAAEIENLDVPLSDDAFKRLLLAYLCVGVDDRAFKILDMFRASGGPVEELLDFTLTHAGALASAADAPLVPGGMPPVQQAERKSALLRVVRKLVAYLSLSPSPAPAAVCVLLNQLVFYGQRTLLCEALAHRRLVQLAPPQLLERAVVALCRGNHAQAQIMLIAAHNNHIKLTLHEFASGVPVTASLLGARAKVLRYVVDPDWDVWGQARGLPPQQVFTAARPQGSAGFDGAGDAHAPDAMHSDRGTGRADGAVPGRVGAAPPEASAAALPWMDSEPPQDAVCSSESAGVSAGSAAAAPPRSVHLATHRLGSLLSDEPRMAPLDSDLRSLTADLMFGNVKRRVDLRAAAATAAAVEAATGSCQAGADAGVALLEALSNTPVSPAFRTGNDAESVRGSAPLYVGPLLGALDPSQPFTSWRSDAALTPEERSDRALRFACGLTLHLEALGYEPSDTMYRILFSTLAWTRKSVAAAQVALRLEARGATLSDSHPLDRLLETLRNRASEEDARLLGARLANALLPAPLCAAYRAHSARVCQGLADKHRSIMGGVWLTSEALKLAHAAATVAPDASPATLAADVAVRALSEPVRETPRAPLRGRHHAPEARPPSGESVPALLPPAASTAEAAALEAWSRAGYPTLRLTTTAPVDETTKLFGELGIGAGEGGSRAIMKIRGGAYWDPDMEVHKNREFLRGQQTGAGEFGSAAYHAAEAKEAPAPMPDRPRWFVGGPKFHKPRFVKPSVHATQPPLSDILPGSYSVHPKKLDLLRRAQDAALEAAVAATQRGLGADAPAPPSAMAPQALVVFEDWNKRKPPGSSSYVIKRPPYLHWLPTPPGWVAVDDASSSAGVDATLDAAGGGHLAGLAAGGLPDDVDGLPAEAAGLAARRQARGRDAALAGGPTEGEDSEAPGGGVLDTDFDYDEADQGPAAAPINVMEEPEQEEQLHALARALPPPQLR